MADLSAYKGNKLFEALIEEIEIIAETDEIELTMQQVKEVAAQMHIYLSETMSDNIRDFIEKVIGNA